MSDPIVIVSAARTPIGGLLGDFAALQAPQLGAVAIKAAVERANVPGDAVDEVLFGCCLMAGQGQAPARQALLGAGLPESAGAVTLSKMCGSGMRAMMFAHDMLAAGSAEVLVAGGMESMTNAPHLLVNARKGYRYGAVTTYDHMAVDGLEDAYERGKPMGWFAENCVTKYKFSREDQDKFAIASTQRAIAANSDGSFEWEIAPVKIAAKGGEVEIGKDEQPFKARLDKIPGLKPAFKKDGTITAANASSISDGAAALVMMRESAAKRGRAADRPHPRAQRPRAGARMVHDRADRGDRQGAQEEPDGPPATSTSGKSTRPSPRSRWPRWSSTSCRTTRSTSTAAPARSGTRSAQRRAHRHHAARRAAQDRRQARRRRTVHRRRRSYCNGNRTYLICSVRMICRCLLRPRWC